jgi:uncharacterized membrane protein YdjX (TVP38/TMEM64 family)
MYKQSSHKKWMLFLLKCIPIAAILAVLLYVGNNLHGLTPDKIVAALPNSRLASAVMLLGLYCAKSVIMFIPVIALYIGTGMVFPPLTAILINVLGLAIELTITFYIGQLSGKQAVAKLTAKHKRVKEVLDMGKTNYMAILVIRLSGLFPVELVSIVLGSVGYTYLPYLLSSLLGLIPFMIPFTLMGKSIQNPLSAEFLLPFFLAVTGSILAMVFYNWLQKQKTKK